MLKDILGRTVKEEDIVIVKSAGNASTNKPQVSLGILVGNNIRFQGGMRNITDMFLVANPTETELAVKQEIIQEMNREKELRSKRGSFKSVLQADMVGHVYRTSRGDCVLYCGKKKVSVFQNGELISEKKGHFYINVGNRINDETIQKYKFANFLSHIEHGIEQFGHFTNYLFDDILKATQEIQYVRVPKSFDVESDYVQKWHKASAIDHVIKTNFKITVEDMNS